MSSLLFGIKELVTYFKAISIAWQIKPVYWLSHLFSVNLRAQLNSFQKNYVTNEHPFYIPIRIRDDYTRIINLTRIFDVSIPLEK